MGFLAGDFDAGDGGEFMRVIHFHRAEGALHVLLADTGGEAESDQCPFGVFLEPVAAAVVVCIAVGCGHHGLHFGWDVDTAVAGCVVVEESLVSEGCPLINLAPW